MILKNEIVKNLDFNRRQKITSLSKYRPYNGYFSKTNVNRKLTKWKGSALLCHVRYHITKIYRK